MTDSQAINELKSDIKEFEDLLGTVIRTNVRTIIADNISSLRSKVEALEATPMDEVEAGKSDHKEGEKLSKPTLYTTKITNYGWDENRSFVKLYITLPDIEKVTDEQITCEFTDCSFKFIANNHNGKNHMLQVVKLAYNIVPSASTCRIKNGNVILSLKKDKEGNTWNFLTGAEKKQKEIKDSKYEPSKNMDASDPSGGIMNLMKQMYDDGDDEMKRMIKKSWYESQQKQKAGEYPPPM